MRRMLADSAAKIGIVIIIGTLLFCNPYSWTEEENNWGSKYSLGVSIGGVISLADVDFDNTFQSAAATVDGDLYPRDGFATNISFRYFLFDWLGIGANLEYSNVQIKADTTVTTTTGGTSTSSYSENFGRDNGISILAVLEGKIPINPNASNFRVSPYLYVGIGYTMHFWQDPGNGGKATVDPSVAITIGVGMEILMTNTVSLTFEGIYRSSKADFEIKSGGTTRYEGELDLSDMRLMIGMRFYL